MLRVFAPAVLLSFPHGVGRLLIFSYLESVHLMLPTRTNTLRSTKSLLPQAGRLTLAALFLLGLAAATPAAHAQGYTIKTLTTFTGANGSDVNGDLLLSNGIFYGTTQTGGANGYGEVFSVPITGGAPTVLVSFNNDLVFGGVAPEANAKLVLSGNTLYGTTVKGGANGFGAVFSVPITGGALTTLASFEGNGSSVTAMTNGANPAAGLTLSGTTLYGTTEFGGIRGYGTVFSIPVTGGAIKTLATFDQSVSSFPTSDLLLSGGKLYGTTQYAGQDNRGAVFSVPITGGQPTDLASFNGDNGSYPSGPLTLLGGKLYGTTSYGGPTNEGTVFSVPTTGGGATLLSDFSFTNAVGPSGGLTQVGDTLYGTAAGGLGLGYHSGIFFSVPVTGGKPTILASFNFLNGAGPTGGLIYSDGIFYGSTLSGSGGDLKGRGSIFAIIPDGAPVPEASTWVSFGLLLVGGLGAMALRVRRRTAAA